VAAEGTTAVTVESRTELTKPGNGENGMAKHLKHISNWDELLVDSNYSLPGLKRELKVSARQLTRQTKSQFQLTIEHYLEVRRFQQAQALLLGPFQPIKNIGLSLGFKHPRSFTTFFTTRQGLTPTEFRRKFVPGAERGSTHE
jgi:AraC-like DNA-binding protein